MRETKLTIENGDFMAGTWFFFRLGDIKELNLFSRYDSTDKKEPVPMGSMGKDEMCNFYMMYYTDASQPDPFPYGAGCFGDQDSETVIKEYPKGVVFNLFFKLI
jgi:hypothetical protein